MRDLSSVNPGSRFFGSSLNEPVYREMNMIIGTLFVTMKKEKRRKRRLDVRINIFADKMRARSWQMRVQLAQRRFSVTQVSADYLY